MNGAWLAASDPHLVTPSPCHPSPCHPSFEPLRRIVAAWVPRMAAANPPYAAQRAGDRPVLPHGLDEVVAARRLKTAMTAEDRAEKNLIEPHQADERQRRQPPQESCPVH